MISNSRLQMNTCGSSWLVLVLLHFQFNVGVDARKKWNGQTVRDLHREYGNIFRYGNRNAASHLWSSFLLDRAEDMTHDKLVEMFGGFCAVSGSPVQAGDYNRYGLTLPMVPATAESSKNDEKPRELFGYMHYCCWPCVCDTQDFIRVDTKSITALDKQTRQLTTKKYHFAVLGNPCLHPEALNKPFYQPFDGRQTTLAREAPEVRCKDSVLEGATMSDNGFVIISMFFDGEAAEEHKLLGGPALQNHQTGKSNAVVADFRNSAIASPHPGRVSVSANGKTTYQSEHEWAGMCENRKNNGYNSGMGEIFRKVAAITEIDLESSSCSDNSTMLLLTTQTAPPTPVVLSN